MRINWGARIILLYTSFVVFMLFMVYKCTRQHYDLVSADYYAQELKYQDVINGSNNLQALNQKIVIGDAGDNYTIQLPVSGNGSANGEVFVYRPSNAAADFKVPVTSNLVSIPKNKMAGGLYKIKMSWSDGQKNYFDEQSLTVK